MSIIDIKTELKKDIRTALKSLGLSPTFIQLDRPKSPQFGDLSTNVALVLAKQAKLDPVDLAHKIQNCLKLPRSEFEKVTVIPPGFMNFTISPDYLREEIHVILQSGDSYGRTSRGEGKTALVEFVSANPTGPLTIGHGRQAVIGDVVSRILEWHGYQVTREYYFNDAGRQIRLLGESVYARYMELLGKDVTFPEDGYQGNYLLDIAQEIRQEYGDSLKDQPDNPIFKNRAVKVIFDDIHATLTQLGIVFDKFVNEKMFYETDRIDSVVQRLRDQGLVYKKNDATWFHTTRLGKEQDIVLIKSSGEPTYRLPDIAYHEYKLERNFDLLVDIFGADHTDTYPDVLLALKCLGYSIDHIRVLIHQFVTLTQSGERVKMSTRKATYVTLEELLDLLGMDVVRYFYIMRSMQSHLNFDLALATKESEENPVYYLQYAHARICNIIKHGLDLGIASTHDADLSLISTPAEINLMRELMRFPEVTITVLDNLEPQGMTTYLQEVATQFHRFYTQCRVITDDIPLSQARLALILATKTVLANGLNILGISQPEKM